MKQRNPHWGCPRIAQQIAVVFHIAIDKDVVRRILAHHYLPGQDSGGPSWLTFLGRMRDSLWSMDLFRCESAMLRTHWVLVVMDRTEGYIADKYFACLRKLHVFPGRKPRDRDKFNSALNYGYGILYNEVERACLYVGLDPYMGLYLSTRKTSGEADFGRSFRV
jgi:hypothetical protein